MSRYEFHTAVTETVAPQAPYREPLHRLRERRKTRTVKITPEPNTHTGIRRYRSL